MRALTDTLLAAQQAPSGEPYLRVRLHDRDLGVPRLRWARWYEGGEAAGPCVAALPADGALLRARIAAGSGTLYASRVASPGSGSDYSSWTSLGTVAVTPRLGLGAAGTRGLLASVRADGVSVEVRESTDSGATFGTSSVVATAGGTVTAIACTLEASGTAAVFYAVAGGVYVVKRTGTGAWSAPAAWTLSLASVSALAATFELDHQVVVSGATSAGVEGAWVTTYGAGGAVPPAAWTPLVALATADAGTGVTYLATGVGSAGVPRAALVEAYGGAGAYARVQLASALLETVFADQAWRDPQPLDVTGAHGAGFAANDDGAWLVTASGVWHAAIDDVATELTDDVLECDVQQSRTHGRLRLVLRNDDGRYHVAAAPLALAPGGELLVDPGYVTAVGAEASEGMRWWVISVQRAFARGVATVEIEAVDGWGVLEAWRAPRDLAWAAGTAAASDVLRAIAAGTGLRLTADAASAESNLLRPAYVVRAGTRAATAFRSLLDALPDLVTMRGSGPTLREPLPDDATDYAYGDTHPVTAVRIEDAAGASGWARVFGDGVFAEAVDAAALRGGAATAVVVDDNLDAQARADARATTVLRKTQLAVEAGELVAPPHCGQEVGDVIVVTSLPLGLDAARYRVASLRLRFARGSARPVYEMTLGLSAV